MEPTSYQHINLKDLFYLADGEYGFVLEIISEYEKRIPKNIAAMKSDAQTGDLASVKFMAHKLKSSFQFMGAFHLSKEASEIERLCTHSGDSDRINFLVEEIKKQFNFAKDELGLEIKRLKKLIEP